MIYLRGDTHNEDLVHLGAIDFTNKNLTKEDFVIVLGDFGLLWSNSEDNLEKSNIRMLNERKFSTLWLDGNHENFLRINHLPTKDFAGGKVGVISDSILHLKRGEVYELQGKKFFVFGGGYSIDKAWRTPYVSWWPEELPNYAEYKNGLDNLEKHNWKVDYILTHDAPTSIYAELDRKYNIVKTAGHKLPDYLEEIKNKVEFKHWYFGHFHLEDTFKYKHTCLYKNVVILKD
jgi:hypothetical protein